MTLALTLVLAVATASRSSASDRPPPQPYATGGTFSGVFVIHSITDPLNGRSDTDAFDGTHARRIQFIIIFDSIEKELLAVDPDGHSRRILTTGPARVHFSGDPSGGLQSMVVLSPGCPLQFSIREDNQGTTTLEGFELSAASESQDFYFECFRGDRTQASSGTPSLADARLDDDVVVLQRFAGPLGMTDLATGTVRFTLFDNRPVAVESKTFSEVKALYRDDE